MNPLKSKSLKTISIGLLSLLLGASYAYGQGTTFSKIWGGEFYDNEVNCAVQLDDNGYAAVYATANFTSGLGTGIQINRMNASGEIQWSSHLQQEATTIFAREIIETQSGHLTIAGELFRADGSSHGFVAKLDENGELLWMNDVIKMGTSSTITQLQGIQEDSDGNYVVCGTAYEQKNTPLLAKIKPDGSVSWSKSFAYQADAMFTDLQITSTNQIVVAGDFLSDENESGLLIATFSPDGEMVFNKTYSTDNEALYFTSKNINMNQEHIYVTGVVEQVVDVKDPNASAPFPDGFILSTDLSGDNSQLYSVEGGSESLVTDILVKGSTLYALHHYNGIFVSAFSINDMTVPPSALPNLWNKEYRTGEATGEVVVSTNFGFMILGQDRTSGKKNGKQEILGLNYMAAVNFKGAGACEETTTMTLTPKNHNVTAEDATTTESASYIEQYSPSQYSLETPFDSILCTATLAVDDVDVEFQTINVFPNPFSNQTTIRFAQTPSQSYDITLFDANGRLVKKMEDLNGQEQIIARDGLHKGFYFLHVGSNQNIQVIKLVVN